MTYIKRWFLFSFLLLPTKFKELKSHCGLVLCMLFTIFSYAGPGAIDLNSLTKVSEEENAELNQKIKLPYSLQKDVFLFKDANNALKLSDILKVEMTDVKGFTDNPLDVHASYWLKVNIKGHVEKKDELMLMFSSDALGVESWERIEAYLLHENGQVDTVITGNSVEDIHKPIPSVLNLASFSIHPNEHVTLYIKYQGIPAIFDSNRYKLNAFIIDKETIPGAFDGYPFQGNFLKHDAKNSCNYLYNHQIFVDDSKALDVDYINQHWETLEKFSPLDYLQKSNEVYWLKTTIKSNPYLLGEQLFQVSSRSKHFYTFKKMDAFINRNGKFKHIRSGEALAINERAFSSWTTILPIYFNEKDSLDIFIRLEGGLEKAKMGQLLIKHINKDFFLKQQTQQAKLSGFYFGVFCAFCLLFLMLFFIEQERINLYLFLMVVGVIMALIFGDPNRPFNIIPRIRTYAVYMWNLGGVLITTSFIKFTEKYFSYDKNSNFSKYGIPLIIFVSFFVAFIEAQFVIDYSKYSYKLSLITHLIQIISIVIAVVMAIKAKYIRSNSKRFYFIAFFPVAVFVFLTLFFLVLGRIPSLEDIPWIKYLYNFVVNNGSSIVRVNLIFSLSLFALSMGNRTNMLKADQRLLHDIEEKNKSIVLLLKEIHHRVKNNLEIVSSLLELQSNQITDHNAKIALESTQSRVHSMAIIHQKLYQGNDISAIKMKDYFLDLVEGTLYNYNLQDKVHFKCEMEEMELDIDHAIPIGLIVNELITNSLKYAFENHKSPEIRIHLEQASSQEYRLIVSDNGIGKQIDSEPQGFGTQLVELLTQQLGGTIHEKDVNGTHFEITFKPTA